MFQYHKFFWKRQQTNLKPQFMFLIFILLLFVLFCFYTAQSKIFQEEKSHESVHITINNKLYTLPKYFIAGYKGFVYPGQTAYYSGWISRRYFSLGFIDGDANNIWDSSVPWRKVEEFKKPNLARFIEPEISPELELLIELDDAMKAVYSAENDHLVAVELGCACGPQLGTVAAINRRSRKLKMKLIGVEAEPKKLEMFHLNMQDNFVSPKDYQLIHGAISIDNKPLNFTFNAGDASEDYGSHVVSTKLSNILTAGNRQVFVEVPTFTVCGIIQDEHYVDYLHMDIQGMELYVLMHHIRCLNEKVRILHIGVHGYAIYTAVIEILLNNGWILKHFVPGVTANPTNVRIFPSKFGELYSQDGIISAINTRFSHFRHFPLLISS